MDVGMREGPDRSVLCINKQVKLREGLKLTDGQTAENWNSNEGTGAVFTRCSMLIPVSVYLTLGQKLRYTFWGRG